MLSDCKYVQGHLGSKRMKLMGAPNCFQTQRVKVSSSPPFLLCSTSLSKQSVAISAVYNNGGQRLRGCEHFSCLFSARFILCMAISLNSLVFTIRRQLVNRKPEPTLLPTQWIFNFPHHIDMIWEQLASDDTVWYTQCQFVRGDSMGNWTADLQIRSLTSEKSQTP